MFTLILHFTWQTFELAGRIVYVQSVFCFAGFRRVILRQRDVAPHFISPETFVAKQIKKK